LWNCIQSRSSRNRLIFSVICWIWFMSVPPAFWIFETSP